VISGEGRVQGGVEGGLVEVGGQAVARKCAELLRAPHACAASRQVLMQ
jgi:hypothetical protein